MSCMVLLESFFKREKNKYPEKLNKKYWTATISTLREMAKIKKATIG